MQNKLTTLEIASLKPKDHHYLIGDGGGLNIKVYPNGRKQWILRKTSKGKATNTVLGDFPSMSLASARAKAKELAAKFVDGRKQKEDTPVLFGDLMSQWFSTKDYRANSVININNA